MSKHSQAAQKGPDARRRPTAAREAYSLYVERAAEGANEADGPFSAACLARAEQQEHRAAALVTRLRVVAEPLLARNRLDDALHHQPRIHETVDQRGERA